MPVGDFATFQRGFDLPNQSRIEGDVPIVSSGGVSGFHNEAKVERAGLVTGRYGSIGELFYLDGPHWPLNTSLWVKDFHGNEIKFAYYLLSRIDFRSLSDKTGVPGVNRNDVHKLQTAKPKLPEQQKIAAFLGAVDEKIGQLTRKKALLEDYKKGCMQQLFTQKLRFKDDQGNDFPDWEEKKLGDVLTIGSGRDYKHLGAGNIPVYGTGGYMLSVDDYLYDGESVCIGRKGTIDSPALLNGKFWTVDTLFYTHSYQGVLPRFIFAIFQQINWAKYNEASGVPSLSKATIEQIAVGIPHPDEQRKIADFLSAIDAKISLVADELRAAQNFKRGLLQQMSV